MRAISEADGVHPPFAKYSHAIEVPPAARTLFVSGQLGIDGDKRVPPDAAGQAELIFQAIASILAEARMTMADLVRLNAYVVDRADLPAYMAVRDRHVATPPPASTLLLVAGFTRPEFRLEVEAVAARVD
jgi:2-iminobutanoate/2-iminopropanoate deaminase